MIYSIEDQIKAINLARKTLKGSENVLNDAANTLESIRLIGIEKVMHAKEMYDLLSSWQGSGWLNEPSEVKHGMVNDMMNRIWKYKQEL